MTSRGIFSQILLAMMIGVSIGCVVGGAIILILAAPPYVVAFLPKTPTPLPTPTSLATITLAPTRSLPSRTPLPALADTPVPATPIALTSPSAVAAPSTPAPTTAPLTRTITSAPTKTAAPTRSPRPFTPHLIVGRPVAMSVALNNPATNPDRTYLYGTTQKGDYDVHHGEEFVNPTGTDLFAVASGNIVTAGNDVNKICGDAANALCGAMIYTGKGFYGNLVVIQLTQTYKGQPVFALYGHMSKISVKVGDSVAPGDLIGEIGMSGIADGPHVHFEIRIGTNDYGHTRNPILWMVPLSGKGSLAGRYADTKGNLIRGAIVNVYRADGTFVVSVETYGRDRYLAVNSDDDLGENFAISDLPAGNYTVKIAGQPFVQPVTIQDGKLSFVEVGGAP